MDERWTELAKVLVNYSVKVQPGDRVLITMMETDTYPLARACYQEAIRAGGMPFIEFQSVYLERDLMKLGNDEQVAWVNEMHLHGMDWADCYIGLRGARNPSEFSGIDSGRLASHKKAMGVISARRCDATRWVLTRVPNESFAQQSGKALDDMMDFYSASTTCDYEATLDFLTKVKALYDRGTQVRIVGKDTDITFSTKGKTYELGDGKCNIPDGEIFTSPDETTVNGYIYFEFPGVYSGKNIYGIRLAFENGVLTEARSDTDNELLQGILHMDEGACKVGEFGIGLNYNITDYCYDILYDEKIGGTIHLAMGRAYTECGGKNYSALHWDIVKDLRQEGSVYVDGVKIMEKGKYIFPKEQ